MNKLRLNLVIDIEVSDDYLEKIKKSLLLEVCKHCFRNNSKKVISESFEILTKEEV